MALGGFLGRLGSMFKGQTNPIAQEIPSPSGSDFAQEAPSSDYDTMMDDFGKHWGQTSEGLEDLMGKVSHHESKGKNVYQTGGGPGAGLFQYETGAGQGGMTARNRLAKWYGSKGMDTPDWLNQEGMDTAGFDATKLNPEQQKMLFMADKRYHPTASLSPEATKDVGEWWAQNHWAGGEKGSDIYNTRVASFNRDLNHNQPVDDTMAGYNKVNNAFTY
jgi:hypothetical protein